MKKLVYSILAIVAASLAFSCAKNMEAEIANEDQVQPETRTFTCVFAEPDTKFSVDATGKTQWEVGDEIMIHGGKDGAERYKVTLAAGDISADHKKATISFTINPYDRTSAGVKSMYYAQYPASLVPDGNMYYESRFSDSNDFIMAACDVDGTFVFFNLCGIISYKVSGDFDKVAFFGNNGEVVGYSGTFQARVRDDGAGAVLTNPKFGNGSGDPVALTKVERVPVVDGTTTNYIFIPAGANFTEGFTFHFYKGGEIKKEAKSNPKAINVATGKLLALGDITSHLDDYEEEVDPTSSHKSAITGATDLSAQQANCYVITVPGKYKLPSLKGNSADPTLHVHDVQLVWESYNNDTEVTPNSIIAAIDFEDDWVYFQTPETLKPGNAVIAAKDHKGNIVWSWHIWIPVSAPAIVDATTICGHKIMDRNLGALVPVDTSEGAAVESYGLMYQWGRKDPFPGPKRVDSEKLALIAGTAFVLKDQSKEVYVSGDLVKGSMTITETIQNPTVFGNYGGGDWDPSGNTERWLRTSKGLYDPCPAGYRVMPRESESVLWNGTNIATAATTAGMTWESNLEKHFVKVADGDNAVVIPLAGYIDDCDVKTVPYFEYPGKRAAVYAAYLSSGSPYHLNIREDKTDYHKAGTTSCARGASVRCVVIPAE